ncbi:MAG: gamma-glutamyltransferase family protein [Alphaproteobacteria bacterium]|nr:gamma-glutamyltransferase family protein [Alphaproteobacteria bacterium]
MGLDLVPGTGLLPAVVPGAFDAWMHLAEAHGTLSPEQIFGPALDYAETGVPVHPRLAATLAALETVFRRDWPDSAALWLRGGMPAAGTALANPVLAATWRRLLASGGGTRTARFAAMRAAWSDGFVAAAIDAYCMKARVVDISGHANAAFLRGDDLAGWRAPVEAPVAQEWQGRRVLKCGPWSQGPVLLQLLAMIGDDPVLAGDPAGPEYVHLLAEATKLVMADREVFYGDPLHADVPLAALLSADYAHRRRASIGAHASAAFRPGPLAGGWLPDFHAALGRQRADGVLGAYGAGEPTFLTLDQAARPVAAVGDTSAICAMDAAGNTVATTPSGGWLQASPVIPELGFCLGTRGQSFWLDADHPNGLRPGRRPRTTLTPTMALGADGAPVYASACPGGDQQDQWQLQVLLRHVRHGQNLQAAIDAPGFHAEQWPSSFYPRGAVAQALKLESRFSESCVAALRARGHAVTLVEPWSEGRICAVARHDGWLCAGASPRGDQAYAVGR